MKVKAIQSFIGRISMNIDDEKEIIDKKLAEDLIKAGYVVEIKTAKITADTQQKKEVTAEQTAEQKTNRKRKKKK